MSKKSQIPGPQNGHHFESSFENSPQPLATSSVNRAKIQPQDHKTLLQKTRNSAAVSRVTDKDAAEINALQKKVNEIKASNSRRPNNLDSKKQKDVLEQLEEIQQSLDEKYRRLSNNINLKTKCKLSNALSTSSHGTRERDRGTSDPRHLNSDLLVPGILDFDCPRSRHPSSVSSLGIIDENGAEFNSAFQGVDPNENFDHILQSRSTAQPLAKANAKSMLFDGRSMPTSDKRLTHVIPESDNQFTYQNDNIENEDPNLRQIRRAGSGNRVTFDTRDSKRQYEAKIYADSRPSIPTSGSPRQSGIMGSRPGQLIEDSMVPEKDGSFARDPKSDLFQYGLDEQELCSRPSLAQSRLSMQRRLAHLCLSEEASGEALHSASSRDTFDVLSPPSNLVSNDGDDSFTALKAQQQAANFSALSEEFNISGSKFLAERAEQDHEDWVRSHAPIPLLENEMRAGSFSLGGASSVSITPSEYFACGSESLRSINLEDLLKSENQRRHLPLNTTVTLNSSEDDKTLKEADSNESEVELDEACAMNSAPVCMQPCKDTSLGNSTQAVMRRYEEDRESVYSSVSSVVSTSQLARILEQHSDLDSKSALFQEFLQEVSSKNSSKKSSQRSSPCTTNSRHSSVPSSLPSGSYPTHPLSMSGCSEEFFLLHRPDSASSMRDVDSPGKSSYAGPRSSYAGTRNSCEDTRSSASRVEQINSTVCLESTQGPPPCSHHYIFYLSSSHSTSSPLTPLLMDPPPLQPRRSSSRTRYSSSLNSMFSDEGIDSGEFESREGIDDGFDSQGIGGEFGGHRIDSLCLNRDELVRNFKRKLSSKLTDLSGLRLRLNATLLNSTCDEGDLTIASLCQSSTRCDLESGEDTDVQEMDLGHLCIGTTAMISKDICNPCSYMVKCYAELQSVSDSNGAGSDSNGTGSDSNGQKYMSTEPEGDSNETVGDSSPALVLFETDRFDIRPGEQKTAKIYIIPLKTGPLSVQYRFRVVHTFTNGTVSSPSHPSPTISYRTNRVRLISEMPRVELREPELGSINFGIRPSLYESIEQLVLVNRGRAKVPLKFVLEAIKGNMESREEVIQGEMEGRSEFHAKACVDPSVEARFNVHVNTPDVQCSKFATLTGRLQIFLNVKEPIASHLTEKLSLLLHHVHLSTRVTSTPLLLSVSDHLVLQANVPQQISLKNVTNEPLSLKLWIPEDHHEEFLLEPNYIARTQLNKVYTVQCLFQPNVNSKSDRKLVLMIDYNPRSPKTHCFPIKITGVVNSMHNASSNPQLAHPVAQTNQSTQPFHPNNQQHSTEPLNTCKNNAMNPLNTPTQSQQNNQPLQVFNQQFEMYNQPLQPYNNPSQTYNQPSQSYNDPSQTYNQTSHAYNLTSQEPSVNHGTLYKTPSHTVENFHGTQHKTPSQNLNNFSQFSSDHSQAYNPSQAVSVSQPPRSATPLNHSPRARHLRALAPSPSLSVASADGSPLELDCTRSHLCWTALGGGPSSSLNEAPGSTVSFKLRNRNRHREKLNLALINRNHCFKILKDKEPVTELKISLAPMEVRDVTVTFVPSTSTGAMSNAIVITRVHATLDCGDEELPKRVIPLYGFSGRSNVGISGVQKDINQRMIVSLTASSVQALFTLSNSGQAPAFALVRSSNSGLLRVDTPGELLLAPNSDPQIVELSLALVEFGTAVSELLASRGKSDVVEIARVTILYGEESARARLKRIVSRLPDHSPVLKDYLYLPDIVNMFGGEVFCNTKKLRDTQEMLGPLYTKDISQVTIGILMDKSDIEMILLDTTVVFEELNSTLYKTHLPSE